MPATAVSANVNSTDIFLSNSTHLAFGVDGSGNANSHIVFDGTNLVIDSDSDAGSGGAIVLDSGGNGVGIGITTPREQLHVIGQFALGDDLGSANSADFYVFRGGGTRPLIRLLDATNDSFIQGGQTLRFGSFVTLGTTHDMELDANGNLIIGSITAGTSAARSLQLSNGVAPTGNIAGAQIYAESGEAKVRDASGNVTTFSPHQFGLIPGGASEPMAWSYYSERDGVAINADITRALRLLEDLTGETLVYIAEV